MDAIKINKKMITKEQLLALTNEQLDKINMLPVYHQLIDAPEREYLLRKSGVEHYRLLYWIAQNVNDINIVEIGSFNGISTACWCSNPRNEVFAYDLDFSTLHFRERPNNLTLMPVPKDDREWFDKEGVLDCSLIFVDTFHSGVLEKNLIQYLTEKKWEGVVIMDDIFWGVFMNRMWNWVINDKIDITDIGHSFGTGVVFFNQEK